MHDLYACRGLPSDGVILVYGNYKGGCGKTVSAVYTAQVLADEGQRVGLVDADRQGTATLWAKQVGERGTPLGAELEPVIGSVSDTLRRVRNRYNHVIVDAGPADRPAFLDAADCADLIVIPTKPQTTDYAQVRAVRVDLQQYRPGLPVFGLLTMSRSGMTAVKELRGLFRGKRADTDQQLGLSTVIPLRERETNDTVFQIPPRKGSTLYIAYQSVLREIEKLIQAVPAR